MEILIMLFTVGVTASLFAPKQPKPVEVKRPSTQVNQTTVDRSNRPYGSVKYLEDM